MESYAVKLLRSTKCMLNYFVKTGGVVSFIQSFVLSVNRITQERGNGSRSTMVGMGTLAGVDSYKALGHVSPPPLRLAHVHHIWQFSVLVQFIIFM